MNCEISERNRYGSPSTNVFDELKKKRFYKYNYSEECGGQILIFILVTLSFYKNRKSSLNFNKMKYIWEFTKLNVEVLTAKPFI